MLHNPLLSMAAWLRGPALDTVRTQRGDTETGNQGSRSRSQYQSQSPQNRLQDIQIRLLRQRLSFPHSGKRRNENILDFSIALYSGNLEVSLGYQSRYFCSPTEKLKPPVLDLVYFSKVTFLFDDACSLEYILPPNCFELDSTRQLFDRTSFLNS